VEPLLDQFGVLSQLSEAVGERHTGMWIEWAGPRRFEPFGGDAAGPWQGFQVWRADFDAILLERARGLGVLVNQGCRVTGVLRQDGVLRGVRTSAGPIVARMVVDATGAARWLCRALGIASPAHSPRLFARYGYVQGSCPARDTAPLLVGDETGWTWSARVKAGRYQWTRLRFGSRARGGAPDDLRDLDPFGPERGADVTWRLAERTAGPGWFLVGDAAALLDPASSHGVLRALLSGITAGSLIAAILGGKAPAEETAKVYHDWIAGSFATDAARLQAFYRELGARGFA
jgi:flavin-dependent dehydrogenase